MTVADFVNQHAIACGGNWGAMLMSAIKNGLPKVYEELDDDRDYEFSELFAIIEQNIEGRDKV